MKALLQAIFWLFATLAFTLIFGTITFIALARHNLPLHTLIPLFSLTYLMSFLTCLTGWIDQTL